MKIHQRQAKRTPGWFYWGATDEIDVGISYCHIKSEADFVADQPHYHRQGKIYILTLEGKGTLSVNETDIEQAEGTVIEVEPGEVYYHSAALQTPLSWVTFCTIKGPADKVVL